MKSKGIAYVLLLLLGLLGIHKFYLGKIGMGILYLFTLGFGGIGWLIDLFTLGTQVENYNLNKQMKMTNQNLNAMAQGMTAMSGAVGASAASMATATMATVNKQQNQPPVQQFVQLPTQPNEGVDKVKQLTELKSLLDSGILSQEEFEAEKTKILNS